MTRPFTKRVLAVLTVLAVVIALAVPFAALAKDWWIFPVDYTLLGREPITTAGPQSRVFLPELYCATSDDGIDMDMIYEVKKDGEVFASGEYTKGMYIDLNGAGTYQFVIKGVDADNDYVFTVEAKDENPSLIHEGTIPQAVKQQDMLILPGAQIVFGEQIADAEIRLIMASGSVYQYEGKSMPEAGAMEVEYSAVIDGKKYAFTFPVDVVASGIGFYDEAGNFYEGGVKLFEDRNTGAWLDDTLQKTYTFSQVLDISQLTTDTPLLVMSSNAGGGVPKVQIVDAHDPTNYIELLGRSSVDNGDMVYTVANAPGQNKVGHLGGTRLYTQNIFGTETTFSVRYGNRVATFYYNAAEKAVYADWYGRISLIADFDADYNMKPWGGFTTGEVYLKVIRGSERDFVCVESVCGISLQGEPKDGTAPTLTVDVDESNIPFAVVGQKYPVFPAKTTDIFDTNASLDIHVYKGSDAASGIELNIADGCFVPYSAGYYTIVYSSSDRDGNSSEKRISVLAYAQDTAPVLTGTVEGLPTTGYAGDKVMLPEIQNVNGGSGEVSCIVRMRAADGTVTTVNENYVLLPGTGTNTIEYVLTDYLGRETVLSFPVSCTVSALPILFDLEIAEHLQSGTVYQLPEAEYAADASVTTSITATLDGVSIPVNDNVVVPETGAARSELVITYHATNGNGETTKSYTAYVYGCDIADRTSFFYMEKGNAVLTQDMSGIRINATEATTLRFVSSVLGDKFGINLLVNPEINDSDRIILTLTDAYNPEISIQVEIVSYPDGTAGSKSMVYVNGVQGKDMVGNFYGGVESMKLSYQKNSKSLVDAQGNSVAKIVTDLAGNPFNGFPSNQVLLTVGTGDVGAEGFEFTILQINNQVFGDDSMFFDNYPEINISGTLDLQCELGGQIVVPSASSVDVLSPSVNLSLTVRKGATPILENQPVDQDYTVTFEEYGKYFIVYNYTVGDFSRTVTYPVQIIEHTPPQVTMPSLPTEATVGQNVTFAMPTVTDDHSIDVTVSILIQDPEFTMSRLDMDAMSFKPDTAGTYVIYYYVYDECSNYQLFRHILTVK